MPKQCHPRRLISLTFLFIIPLAIAALCLGRYPLSLATVLTTLTEPTRTSLASNIILALRLPRIIGALLIGAAAPMRSAFPNRWDLPWYAVRSSCTSFAIIDAAVPTTP